MKDSTHYSLLGVSSSKEEIISFAHSQGEGLYPNAFCKIVPDYITGYSNSCLAFHSDGVGTKSIVSYLLYQETKEALVFESLAQDALVMNIDDLLCVGAKGPFLVTNIINRNKSLISNKIVEVIMNGYKKCVDHFAKYGVEIILCGGETADVGDAVRTLTVDASVMCRLDRREVIDGTKIKSGDVIVGLSSTGQTIYEQTENSGIGSNGLTLARNVLLSGMYKEMYPEVVTPQIPHRLTYSGKYDLFDEPEGVGMSIAQALLSPTRTYAPVIIDILNEIGSDVHGIVHCTGGGQTKCLRLNKNLFFLKDDIFQTPSLFKLIHDEGNFSLDEMYKVFNMGHRMELFVDPYVADIVINIANSFGVDAKIIGSCSTKTSEFNLCIKRSDNDKLFLV